MNTFFSISNWTHEELASHFLLPRHTPTAYPGSTPGFKINVVPVQVCGKVMFYTRLSFCPRGGGGGRTCHRHPLPYMPPAMHTPCHTHPSCHAYPLPHTPPCHAYPLPHTPLSCTPRAMLAPCHAPPPATHASPRHTRPYRNMVNEPAVRFLLECIIV